MIWFFAFFSLGLACIAVGFVLGVHHKITEEYRLTSDYENTSTDPIDVYIPVQVQPKVYDWEEE